MGALTCINDYLKIYGGWTPRRRRRPGGSGGPMVGWRRRSSGSPFPGHRCTMAGSKLDGAGIQKMKTIDEANIQLARLHGIVEQYALSPLSPKCSQRREQLMVWAHHGLRSGTAGG